MLIFDSHLDLAMNALEWNRNLDLDVYEIREIEKGMTELGRARGTTTLPEMRKGEVLLALATVISRTQRPGNTRPGSACQEISYAKAQGQLAYYRVLESQGKVKMIGDLTGLKGHLKLCREEPQSAPLGFILSMEGADPIVWPGQVASWWNDGLRVVSLSHYGLSAYAYGTDTEGGITESGLELLREMDEIGMILDLTHLADQAFWEALKNFRGPVLASHSNCRALVPGQRQFTDGQLESIMERNGIIGVALDAWMLYPGWIRGETQNTVVSLEAVADHIDHICQLSGNANHAGIGSDLDGGYGTEQCPYNLDTIADLQKIAALLQDKGYSERDIKQVTHENWVRFFREAWKNL